MARRALLVGINNYRNPADNLRGCINDVRNMRDILKSYFGFRNDDIRILTDDRATKENIIVRLEWMVANARAGDVLIFHFAGHGSQIRDRNGDELEDHMDELICPYDMDWDNCFILDDDLNRIFQKLPASASLEVFLDCCHSGTGMRSIAAPSEHPSKIRFLRPPVDIMSRHEGDEKHLKPTRSFQSENRSTGRHILWAASRSDQTSADAFIEGNYNGAFTYHFCRHMRETEGNVSRRNLIERIRSTIRYDSAQIPQLECGDASALDKRPLQFPMLAERERLLFLTSPYLRGDDVKRIQQALAKQGYDIEADGIFGPYTRVIVMKFQSKKGLIVDGVVGPAVRAALFG